MAYDPDALFGPVVAEKPPKDDAPKPAKAQRKASTYDPDALFGEVKEPPPPEKGTLESIGDFIGGVVDKIGETDGQTEPLPFDGTAEERAVRKATSREPKLLDTLDATGKPDPLIERRGGPLSKEAFDGIKRSLAAMPKAAREAQLGRRDLPQWMLQAVVEAGRQIRQDDDAAARTGVVKPDASAEARAETMIQGGMRGDVAQGVGQVQAEQGGMTIPPAQARPGMDPGITIEQEAQAKEEGRQAQGGGVAQQGAFQAGQGLKQAMHGTMAMALRAAGDEEGAKLYEAEGAKAQARVEAAGELMAMRQRAGEMGIVDTGPADYLERMSVGAANSVGQMLPPMAAGAAAGIATANPLVGARVAMGLMSGQVFGQEFINGRTQGLAPAHAAGRASIMASLEYIGERYGLIPQAMRALSGKAAAVPLEELPRWAERAVAAMEKRKLFTERVGQHVRGQVGEQIGEQITSTGQYLLDGTKMGLDEDISVQGFLENARDTAVQTLIATGVMQAGGVVGSGVVRRMTGGERQPPAPRVEPTMGDLPPVPPAAPTAPTSDAGAPSAPDAPAAPTGEPLDAGALLGTPIDEAAHGAATSPTNDRPEPTDAQKKAGNYAMGHIKLEGLDISIENPQGSVRRGTDEDGKAWENTLQSHYGYVRGTEGADGDHIDAFIKPGMADDHQGPIFVIDQRSPKTGKFDEHKVMFGYATPQEAEAGYRANYAPGWDGLGYLTGLDAPAFRDWIKNGNHKEPFSAGFKETKRGKQPVVAAPAPVPGTGGAPAGAVGGRSGGNVGLLPGVDNGLGAPAAAPAPGSGTPGAARDADQPASALSDTPDFETTYPRPQFDELAQAGRNSMFEGMEDDDATLAKAVKGVHEETAAGIKTDLMTAALLRDGIEAGTDPATGKPAKPERLKAMRDELGGVLQNIEGTLSEYASEFGDQHAQAFRERVAPDLAALSEPLPAERQLPDTNSTATPEQKAKTQAQKDADAAIEDLGKLLGGKPASNAQPVVTPTESAPEANAEQGDTALAADQNAAKRAAITGELAKLQAKYEKLSSKPDMRVPPAIRADALNSIAKKMDKLDAKLKALGQPTAEPVTAAPVAESQAPAPSEPGDGGVATTQAGSDPQPADTVAAKKAAIKKRAAGSGAYPKTVNGSGMLADINRQLGGISIDMLTELSFRKETGFTDRYGRPIIAWFNPPATRGNAKGQNGLFREGGIGDMVELAEWMEIEGYITVGTVEADYKAATEMARKAVTDALNKEEPQTQDEMEAELQAEQDAEREAWYQAADEKAAEEAEELRLFLLGEAGITAAEFDTIDDSWFIPGEPVWDEPVTLESLLESFGWSDQEINDAIYEDQQVAEANEQARRAEAEATDFGPQDRGDGPGQAGAADAPGAPAPQPAGDAQGLTFEQRQEQSRRVDDIITKMTGPQVKAVARLLDIDATRTVEMLRTLLLVRDPQQVLAAAHRLRGEPNAPTIAPEADDFDLTAPTPAELQAAEDRAAAAARAEAAEQKRLADKAAADAQAPEFVLTGSNRPADVAAAAGQQDIFDQPAEPAAPAEPPPVPPSFAAKHMVTTMAYSEADGKMVPTEMDAKTALAALDADIAELTAFLKCIRG